MDPLCAVGKLSTVGRFSVVTAHFCCCFALKLAKFIALLQ